MLLPRNSGNAPVSRRSLREARRRPVARGVAASDDEAGAKAERRNRAHVQSHAALAAGSKSFRLAGRLLSPRVSNDAAVCYAWCRRADDRIDDAADPRAGVQRLQDELDAVYSVRAIEDEVLGAFQEVVARRRIPRAYPQALLDGFAMDAGGARYQSWAELDLYCYRVAGVVGLMMAHILGVHDRRCLPAAVKLGMAMQLTNISRDVLEDWRRGRLYLPAALVGGTLAVQGDAPPVASLPLFSQAVQALLKRAARRYRAAHAGFVDLPWRSAFAIRVAALVYADIGRVIEGRDFDVLAGRAVVSLSRKLWLVACAAAGALAEAPRRAWRWGHGRGKKSMIVIPDGELRYPDDLVPGD
jgi:phytoene synthase